MNAHFTQYLYKIHKKMETETVSYSLTAKLAHVNQPYGHCYWLIISTRPEI